MKLGRCPVCHEHITLTQLVQDEAGRELLGLLAKLDTLSGSALVMYLALFRTGKRDLANDKALRLARELEVLAAGNWQRLELAMNATAERLREKGNTKPLANHNYLKRVLDDLPAEVAQTNSNINKPSAPPSKGVGGLTALEGLKSE